MSNSVVLVVAIVVVGFVILACTIWTGISLYRSGLGLRAAWRKCATTPNPAYWRGILVIGMSIGTLLGGLGLVCLFWWVVPWLLHTPR